jgi:hypothetical protein
LAQASGKCRPALDGGTINLHRVNPPHRAGGGKLRFRLEAGAQDPDRGGTGPSEMAHGNARFGAHPDTLQFMVVNHGEERGGIDVKKQERAERTQVGPMQRRAEHVGGETQAGNTQRRNCAVEIAHEKRAGSAICIEMMARQILGFAKLKFFQRVLRCVYGVSDREQFADVIVCQENRYNKN